VQIGQTEPNTKQLLGIWVPEGVLKYVEWRSLFKAQGNKIKEIRRTTNFFLMFYVILAYSR